jgi:hypothetical protein
VSAQVVEDGVDALPARVDPGFGVFQEGDEIGGRAPVAGWNAPKT